VHHARRRLDEDGGVGVHASHAEHLACRRHEVFGEGARMRRAQAGQVRAHQRPSRAAVVAVPAAGVGVDGHLFAEAQARDVVPDAVDDSHHLVAGSEREDGEELPLVQVQVGPADAGLEHLDPHLARARFRGRDLANREGPRGVVHDRFHEHPPDGPSYGWSVRGGSPRGDDVRGGQHVQVLDHCDGIRGSEHE
jgi:hypothetical protein